VFISVGICAAPEVHVIGIYETSSSHSGSYHPTTDARVRIERAGDQVLVLSSYEPVRWYIDVATNVRLQAVHFIGYYNQTLASAHDNIVVTADIATNAACGYSWPYSGGGCDTLVMLEVARNRTAREIKSFHGCYQASEWTLRADLTATSNCATPVGYEQYSWYPACPAPTAGWIRSNFTAAGNLSCSGNRYVSYNAKYYLWVGAVLCDSLGRYKLYLNHESNGTFFEIADNFGHVQDHCELVNPMFSSGGCAQCSLGGLTNPQDGNVYARTFFERSYARRQPYRGLDQSTQWYQCDMNIP
jgi:hypothetical protein